MSFIPISTSRLMGKVLGSVASKIPIQRNIISRDNIHKSFHAKMGKAEINRIHQRVFKHFGQMLFEVPHVFRLNQSNLNNYVVFKGDEHLVKSLKKEKGVFLLTAHFGNWELMCVAIALRFGNLAAVARTSDYPPFDKFLNELRSRFGTEVIPKLNGMRKIFYALKNKKIVGILLDQNVDWYQGVFVKFLGRWACANKALALMALRTQTPVVPAFTVRRNDGRYDIVFQKEVNLIKTGDTTRDIEENTALFTGIIEKQVKEHPDHWFWFHRRWKTLPYCKIPDINMPGP